MMKYPQHLLKVIEVLKKLPGVGTKSAERFAFDLLSWPSQDLSLMGEVLKEMHHHIIPCKSCGCLSDEKGCPFCVYPRLDSQILCVIASAKDAFAIENTGEYKGLFHVIGALLSPIEGIDPEKLNLEALKERIEQHDIKEVIIALDSTLEGDATALYLKQELEPLNVNTSRLAFGIPMGSSLDYVDGGTLARAFSGRGRF